MALVVLLSVATGIGFALFEVLWDTTMAERIPPHALSRASAWEWMGSLALLPIGYLLAGPAAEATQPGDGDGHRRDPHRDRAGYSASCRATRARCSVRTTVHTCNSIRSTGIPQMS